MSLEAINWAFNQEISQSTTKLVLIALADFANDEGIAYPSFTTLENKCSCSRMSISRAIKSLIECGLIAKADLADFAGKKYIKNQNCYQLLFSNKNILVTKLDQYQNDTSTSNKMTSSTSNKSILKPSIYKPSYKPSIKNNKKDSDICKKVIDYLNQIAKTNYKSNSKQTRSLIQARIKEGFTLEDFIQVINNKTKQWISNPEMVAYLRPQTLFGTKMEAYLNEPKAKSRLDNIFGDI